MSRKSAKERRLAVLIDERDRRFIRIEFVVKPAPTAKSLLLIELTEPAMAGATTFAVYVHEWTIWRVTTDIEAADAAQVVD